MSCGSIPVIYADDWMLPFGNALINWTDAVVVIRENDTIHTEEILRSISKEERCRMRRKVIEIYRKYLETGRGVMAGIIENFEIAATTQVPPNRAVYRLAPRATLTVPPNASSPWKTSKEQQPRPVVGTSSQPASSLLNMTFKMGPRAVSAASALNVSSVTSVDNSRSLLNDQTIPWDSSVTRAWLDPNVPNPPGMLLLTNFGWNKANQTDALGYYRGTRTRELVEGIVNHPWFHPTAFQDINSGRMSISNTTRLYLFLDAETCCT